MPAEQQHSRLPAAEPHSAPTSPAFPPPASHDAAPHSASLPGITITSVLKRWGSKNTSVTVSKTWVRRGAKEEAGEGQDEVVRMEEGGVGAQPRTQPGRTASKVQRSLSLYASQDHVEQYQRFLETQRMALPNVAEHA